MAVNTNLVALPIGMVQPNFVLPSQYFGPRPKQAPEQRLMIAVLEDALDCLEKYRFATGTGARRHFDDAKQWFLANETQWLFSFESICGALDLDANAVRRRLRMAPEPQRCTRQIKALATLRRWQFDPRLDGASRQTARPLVCKPQPNDWDEV